MCRPLTRLNPTPSRRLARTDVGNIADRGELPGNFPGILFARDAPHSGWSGSSGPHGTVANSIRGLGLAEEFEMKYAIPIILVAVTAALMVLGLVRDRTGWHERSASPSRIGLYGPPQRRARRIRRSLTSCWMCSAEIGIALSPTYRRPAESTEPAFIQDWTGSNGSLRSFSSLESFDYRPLACHQ